ncbi:helix-turn-helix transcriptional regulator [Streptomyces sp. NPDC050355]|uniref:helix-turn-helix transcriptional regulator n=1 Tax=Streptomyces sp. NPDC050355 TaxID=3365609 RepID=UPI00379D585E
MARATGEDGGMSTSRPLLSQREAADACGVSRTTIRRRREAGQFPGAVLDPQQGWMVPVEDLLAAGFRLNAPAPADPASADGEGPAASPAGDDLGVVELRAEIERLRYEHALELAKAESEKKLAEQEAGHLKQQLAERGERIDDLKRALAALTPAPERAAIPPPAAPARAGVPVVPDQASAPDSVQEPPPRRKWWGGRR